MLLYKNIFLSTFFLFVMVKKTQHSPNLQLEESTGQVDKLACLGIARLMIS